MTLYEKLVSLQPSAHFECRGSELSQDEWLLLHDIGKRYYWRSAAFCSECQTILGRCKSNPILSLVVKPDNFYEGKEWPNSAQYYEALQILVAKVKSKASGPSEPPVSRPVDQLERAKRLGYTEVTPELKDALIASYENGVSATTIADDLKIDRAAVSQILREKGYTLTRRRTTAPKPELTAAQIAESIKLYKKLSIKEIAAKFTTSPEIVSLALKQAGVTIDRSTALNKAMAKKNKKFMKLPVSSRYK